MKVISAVVSTVVLASVVVLGGCTTGQRVASGAGIGALGGAAVSGIAGGNALTGAAVGAVAGGVIGGVTK